MSVKIILLMTCVAMCFATSMHSMIQRNAPFQCPPYNHANVVLNNRLDEIAQSVPWALTVASNTGDFSEFSALLADNVQICVNLGEPTEICYIGRDAVLSYFAIVWYQVYEFLRNLFTYTIHHVASSIVYRRSSMFLTWPIENVQTQVVTEIRHTMYFEYDCNNKITFMTSQADSGDSARSGLLQVSDCNATRICLGGIKEGQSTFRPGIMTACTGANMVYTNSTQCIEFMESIPCTTPQDLLAVGNSRRCRDFHLILTQLYPHLHCIHTSMDGGGKCCDNCVH